MLTVAALSLAAFVVVAALLAVRMRDGHDPLLGAQPAPRRVLVRKVFERVEQVQVVPSAAPAPSPAVSVSSSAAPAPVTRTS